MRRIKSPTEFPWEFFLARANLGYLEAKFSKLYQAVTLAKLQEENMKKKINVNQISGIAVFSALAVVVALVCQVIPNVSGFLSLDAKDAVIAMASFIYGPVSAVVIAFIAAFIEAISFSTTEWYGFIMNFASSAAFSLTASLIYKKHRSLNGALVGFLAAIIVTTSVMLLLNIFVTPLFLVYKGFAPNLEVAKEIVRGMLAKVLLPFNFAKTLLNSALAMMLYKPISNAMSHIGLNKKKMGTKFNKNSVIILIVGSIALALSLLILFIIS